MSFFAGKRTYKTVFTVMALACLAVACTGATASGFGRLGITSGKAGSSPPIVRIENTWKSMGLIRNDDISGHRIEIDRAGRTLLHAVLTNFGEASEEYRYDLDEKTCEEFFLWLERTSGIYRWKDDYTVPMMDGHAWELTVVTEKGSKAVKGNTLPPRGGDVEKRIRALAAFEITPQIF